MSALQKQLASIASSATHELDLKAQKSAHSKSLLFEPSVAANQSFDILYQICIEGFEELCTIDVRFAKFGKSIFSPQSRTEERGLMNASENKELDAVLHKFLGLVGGRLLLMPALKAVEWLVRRFRIHEYNIAYTVLTFLPYHAAPIFPSLLSMLPKQLPSSFKFLYPYMNSLSNPPRSVIVYTSTHNNEFFQHLNHYVLAVSKAQSYHAALIALWASVMTRTVDGKINASRSGRQNMQIQREEEFLIQLLPVLSDALSMKYAPELLLGCYMIIIILVTKSNLDDQTLMALMVSVVKSWRSETMEAGLGCLAAIAEQMEETKIPLKVTKVVCAIPKVSERLKILSTHQNVRKLTLCLAQSCLEDLPRGPGTDVAEFLSELLQQEMLNEGEKEHFWSHIRLTDREEFALKASVENAVTATQQIAEVDDESSQTQNRAELQAHADSSSISGTSSAAEEDTEIVNFSAIPEQAPIESFLSRRLDDVFDQLHSVFQKVASSASRSKPFFGIPIWSSHDSGKTLLLTTFLIRVWCTAPSARVRSIALQQMTDRIDHLVNSLAVKQLALLYALIALLDASGKVRRKAANAIYKLINQDTQGDGGDPWIEEQVYREPLIKGNLSSERITGLMTTSVIPRMEECIIDRKHLLSAFENSVKGVTSQNGLKETDSGKKLRSAERERTLAWIVQHALQTPIMTARLRLLMLLNTVEKVNSQPASLFTISILRQWVASNEEDVHACKKESIDVMDLDYCHVALVHVNGDEELDFLISTAQGGDNTHRKEFLQAAYERLRILWPHLKDLQQINLFKTLLRSATISPKCRHSDTVRIESKSLLGNVHVSAVVLSGVIQALLEGINQAKPSASKRRRVESGSIDAITEDSQNTQQTLVMISLILEVTDSAQHLFNLKLFHALFLILHQIQEYATQRSSDLGYLQSLTLSILASQAQTLSIESSSPSFDPSIVRIDTLVDCIRNTSYMQARQSALIVLGRLSRVMPQSVMHSIIPVFTLMSTSTVTHSDDFSVHIVDQTIQEVIPLLAQKLRTQNEDLVCATADILLSFIAAFRHVPKERRIRLFGLLANSLGCTEVLHAILAALVDSYPEDTEVLQFAALLLNQFDSADALIGISKYLDFIIEDSAASRAILKRSQEMGQIKSVKTNLASAIPHLLDNGIGASKLQASYAAKDLRSQARDNFDQLMERVLHLLSSNDNDSPPRDWCTKILRSMLRLLPLDDFLVSIKSLVGPEHSPEIVQTGLKVAELQIRSAKASSKKPRRAVIAFLSHLTSLLEGTDSEAVKTPTVICIDAICEKFGKHDTVSVLRSVQVISSKCFDASSKLLKSVSLHCIASSVDVLQNDFIPLLQPVLILALDNLRESLEDSVRYTQQYDAAYAVAISILDQLPYLFPQDKLCSLMRLSAQSTRKAFGSDAESSRSQFWQVVTTRLDINVTVESIIKVWQTALVEGPLAVGEHIDALRHSIEKTGKSSVSKHTRTLLESFFTFLDLRRLADCGDKSNDVSASLVESSSTGMLELKIIDSMVALILKINDTAFRPFFVRLIEWATSSLSKGNVRGQTLRLITLFRFSTALSERLRWLVTPYFDYLIEPAASVLTTRSHEAKNTKSRSKSGSESTHVPQSDTAKVLTSCVLTSLISSLRHVATAQQDLDSKVSPSNPDLFKRDATEFYHSAVRFQQLLPALLAPLSLEPFGRSDRLTPSINLSDAKSAEKAHPASLSTSNLSQTLIALALLAITQRSQPAHLTQLTKSLLELCKEDSSRIRINAVKAFRVLTEGTNAVLDSNTLSYVEPEDLVKGIQGVTFDDREDWLARELPAMLPVVAGLQEDDDEGVEKETGLWVRGMEEVLGQRLGELLD